jgi:hypothetical protein
VRAKQLRTEALIEARKQRRQAQARLRRQIRKESQRHGVPVPSTRSIPSRQCRYEDAQEERWQRQEASLEQLGVLRAQLPWLLKRLGRIPDPRHPKKTKHQLTVLLLYGLLTFVLRKASRREANQALSRPMMWENLRLLFPELESLPHHDTLNRVLAAIEVSQIEQTHRELLGRMIRQKKFRRYLIGGHYPISVDGTGKLIRGEALSAEWHERRIPGEKRQVQYSVYVVEASFAFANGMTIPLVSEFLDNTEDELGGDKQDCELRAFERLARRLKQEFAKLPILMILDGLYAKGPVMDRCREYGWQFLIVLQDGCLPGTWEEYEGLGKLQRGNHKELYWGGRRQSYRWVNGIERDYEDRAHKRRAKRQEVHVVVCEERWEAIAPGQNEVVPRQARHAWLSSEPLHGANLHERCNLGARHRWAIEEGFLVEKHHGYQYEHCFSWNWQAMKGYHYLMRLAHALNVLALHTTALARRVRELGVRGVLRLVYETLTGPWFDPEYVAARWRGPLQLRLE